MFNRSFYSLFIYLYFVLFNFVNYYLVFFNVSSSYLICCCVYCTLKGLVILVSSSYAFKFLIYSFFFSSYFYNLSTTSFSYRFSCLNSLLLYLIKWLFSSILRYELASDFSFSYDLFV